MGSGNLYTAINPVYIHPTSRMVSEYTGMKCQPHKAIVGANAFQHESGIHQDGMIKNKATYEIMFPESIGLLRGDAQSGAGIVLGKHSGRNAVGTRLRELGYDLEMDKLNAVFERFKQIAERKKGGLEDEDLEALVSDQGASTQFWKMVGLQVTTGMHGIPTATVKMIGPDGVERYVATTGTGPVDAVYKAIDQIIGVTVELEDYALNSVRDGIEALATTRVVVCPKKDVESMKISVQTDASYSRTFSGTGSDTDIVVSSARAYVSAVNKLLAYNMRRRERLEGENGAAAAPDATEKKATNDGTAGSAILVE